MRVANPQIDQFTQALFGKAEAVIVVCAVLIVVVGVPLYWLRLKAERTIIGAIRSARSRRESQKRGTHVDVSEAVPHCPICNALMVKRLARRGSRSGSTFWGCCNYPKCRGTRAS